MKTHLPVYDEASSSGSDDDDDSSTTSSNSDDESSAASEVETKTKKSKDQNNEEFSSNSSSSSSSSASNDESDDSDSSSSSNNDDDDDDDDDDNEDESSSDDDLPLHERVRKREERGLSLQSSRKRKSEALQVASERLAKFKKEVKSKTRQDGPSSSSYSKSGNKKSKHAPTEVSSKRGDFFKRGAPKLNESGLGVDIGANRYKPLDPRASNLSGHYNEEQFEQNYEFLNKIRQQEISKLKRQIAARKITGRKGQSLRRKLGISNQGSLEEDQEELKRLQQERADLERRKLNRAAKQVVKKKLREQVEQGKGGAYFLKRKEKRRLELEAKMEQIRKKGGDAAVEKAISKRRKKEKSRDAKRFL